MGTVAKPLTLFGVLALLLFLAALQRTRVSRSGVEENFGKQGIEWQQSKRAPLGTFTTLSASPPSQPSGMKEHAAGNESDSAVVSSGSDVVIVIPTDEERLVLVRATRMARQARTEWNTLHASLQAAATLHSPTCINGPTTSGRCIASSGIYIPN
jgi:hypothetical protein